MQRQPLARLLVAMLLAAALTSVVSRTATVATAVLLFALLTIVGFVALTIAPDTIALQRQHYWRWWWRSSTDDGPFWPGMRIPRGPRRPR